MNCIIQNIEIKAIASYLPKENLELLSLANSYGENEVKKIISATGIERVRVSSEDQTSSDMCFYAAEDLIERTETMRNLIDGLVFVSQTPDYKLPATSIILQDRLNLSKNTVCQDIHYGCSGYIYGVFQAALWINSGACSNVLLLSGDTSTKMINPRNKSLKMVFGDAGTATLISKGDDPLAFSISSDGSGAEKLIISAGGFRKPLSPETKKIISDDEGNFRTEEDLYMNGKDIFNFAISEVHKDINELIKMIGWDKEDVKLFALHQANDFMIKYIRNKLKVDSTKVLTNVKNWGNTGPATIPLLFSDLYGSKSGVNNSALDKVIMSGFGVGLSWGSIACNLNETIFIEPINKYLK